MTAMRSAAAALILAAAAIAPRAWGDTAAPPGERAAGAAAETILLPGAANALGTHAARWRSDLTLRNPGDLPIEVRVVFLRPGAPWTTAPSRDYFLVAGETKELRNVVGSELAASGTGALLVSASPSLFPNNPRNAAVVAQLRTARPVLYGSGDVGAVVPAAEVTDAAELVVAGVKHDGTGEKGLRAAAGAVNLSRVSGLTLRVEFLDPAGEAVHTTEIHLPAFSPGQLAVPVRLDGGSVRFTKVDGTGPFVAYATTVDNATGESRFLYAKPPGGRANPLPVPAPAPADAP